MSRPIEPGRTDEEFPAAQEIRVPSRPHMDVPTIAFLRERMQQSRCYLEYGSGGSTRMATRYQIPHVFSVESDLAFAKAVRRAVSHERCTSQLRMSTPDFGPTGPWGYPRTRERAGIWWRYPLDIWGMIRAEQVTPDLILIDGRFRAACFFACLLQAEPGTVILLDDYAGREARYPAVAGILPIREMVGRAAVFEVPATMDHRDVAFALARACSDPA